MLRFFKCPLSLRFSHQNPARIFLLPHTCHIPRPSHPRWFLHQSNIFWRVQIMKLHITQFFSVTCYFLPRRPKHFPQHSRLENLWSIFLPKYDRLSFTPIHNNTHNHSSI
jgi:hypothetical protein